MLWNFLGDITRFFYYMLPEFRFSVGELSCSFADMCSMVPFIPGAVLIADLKLAPVLILSQWPTISSGTGQENNYSEYGSIGKCI